jgi:hypothetical protein
MGCTKVETGVSGLGRGWQGQVAGIWQTLEAELTAGVRIADLDRRIVWRFAD